MSIEYLSVWVYQYVSIWVYKYTTHKLDEVGSIDLDLPSFLETSLNWEFAHLHLLFIEELT